MTHIHVHLGCDEDAESEDVVELGPISPEEAIEIRRELDCFREDALYFDAHRDELLVRYPNQWVAVYQQQVAAVAGELDELFREIDAKGVPRGRVFVEYVCADDEDFVILLP